MAIIGLLSIPNIAVSHSFNITRQNLGEVTELCRSGNDDACASIVNDTFPRRRAEENGLPFNAQLAQEVALIGCRRNHLQSCDWLGVIYFDKDSGRLQDQRQARDIWRQVCDAGFQNSCRNLQNN